MPTSAEQDIIRGQRGRTTRLSSGELRDAWNERIRAEALYSARTTSKAYVEMLKRKLLAVASRETNPQLAERSLQQCLDALGYTPQAGFPDDNGRVPPAVPKTMSDLSASHRIQLILETNIKKARSMGQMAAGESPVFLRTNPAWRLERTGARKKPRGDWKRRWEAAGASVGWQGAAKRSLVALKDSPIWDALGRGVGGFGDTLGSPFPPFAFGSGMAWTNVSRREWVRICQSEGMDTGLDELDAKTAAGLSLLPPIDGGGDGGESSVPQDAPESPDRSAAVERLKEIREKMRAEREREEGPSTRVRRDVAKTDAGAIGEAVEKAESDIGDMRAVALRRIRAVERVYKEAARRSLGRLGGDTEAAGRVNEAVALYDEIAEALRDAERRLGMYAEAIRGAGNMKTAERYISAARKVAQKSERDFGRAQAERKALARDISSR